MRSKLLAMLLILCLILAMVACTGNSKNNNTDPSNTNPPDGPQAGNQDGFEVAEGDTNTEFGEYHIVPWR